jgi:hypothetical protein
MCFMGGSKSSPPPAPPPLPPPPPEPARINDQAVVDARNDQLKRIRGSRGSTSTLLANGGTEGGTLTAGAVPQGNKLLGQ